jgi:hypothetical protein
MECCEIVLNLFWAAPELHVVLACKAMGHLSKSSGVVREGLNYVER